MKTFHFNDDRTRLLFYNYERKSDDEEFNEIMQALENNGNCLIGKVITGPDCDLINCMIDAIPFSVIRTIDGNGTFIFCNDRYAMNALEKIFCYS